ATPVSLRFSPGRVSSRAGTNKSLQPAQRTDRRTSTRRFSRVVSCLSAPRVANTSSTNALSIDSESNGKKPKHDSVLISLPPQHRTQVLQLFLGRVDKHGCLRD